MDLVKNDGLGLGVDLAVADSDRCDCLGDAHPHLKGLHVPTKVKSTGFNARLFDRFVARYGRLPTERDPDYLEMLRMSKYRVMEVPDVQPGKCANCGASKADGRKYIDIGLDIPWYGALFLCSHCLNDVGRHTGLFTELEEKLKKANESVVSSNDLLKQGERVQDGVYRGFEEVKKYFDQLSGVGSHPTLSSGAGLESDKEPDHKTVGKGDRPVDAAKQGATKPATGSGSKNILSLAERLASGS